MKLIKLFILFVAATFIIKGVSAQDCSINLLLPNSGIATVGGTTQLQVDISNTDFTVTAPQNKLRPQITVAPNLTINTIQSLPTGWTITSNTGSTIRVTNTTASLAPNTTVSVFITLTGVTVGSGAVISGNLTFNGPAPPGDFGANNSATTTATIIATLPVTLLNFTASLLNCKPALNWITESEINSDRFEIERATQNTTDWVTIGNATAQGNSAIRNKYNFSDVTVSASTQKVFYRLKMIDKDGQYKYSPVVPVFINCKTTQINTYPNPVQHGLLNVNIITINNEKTEAVLMNATGQVVLKMNLKNGLNNVNVSNIANGEYLLKVNAINSVNKVLIQNKK